MPSKSGDKPAGEEEVGLTPSTERSVLSLFLAIHLLCVFTAISATIGGDAPDPNGGMSIARSPLQAKLLSILRVYTRVLNFEVGYGRYDLTYALALDTDHQVELLPRARSEADAAAWVVLPDAGLRGGDRRRRYQRWAEQMGFFSGEGEVAAALARAAADNYLDRTGEKPAQVRCRRHRLWSTEEVRRGVAEPVDPAVFAEFPYRANVVIDDRRNVIAGVMPIEAAGEVARPGAQRSSGAEGRK